MDRVALIREHVPDCAITTDIIVGFPGESEAEFRETLEVVEEVGFDGAFTFIYSPRRDTEAAAFTDRFIAHEVQVERMERLVEVVQRRARERAQRFVGRTLDVLVEGHSRNDPSQAARPHDATTRSSTSRASPSRARSSRSDHLGDEPDARRRGIAARPGTLALRPAAVRTCVRAMGRPAIESDARAPARLSRGRLRTFDAPEALDTRFYEVHAKSAINKCRRRRGCRSVLPLIRIGDARHACASARTDTPVLMADGGTPDRRPPRGRRVIGTVVAGGIGATRPRRPRSLVALKPAYGVVLEDGTELIASGDHVSSPSGVEARRSRGRPGQPQSTACANALMNRLPWNSRFLARTTAANISRGCSAGMPHLLVYYEGPGRTSADVHRFRRGRWSGSDAGAAPAAPRERRASTRAS